MEKSFKAQKKNSDQSVTKTILKGNLPDMKERTPFRYNYFAASVNGRSKENINKARLRLRHHRTFMVSKRTRFDESRLQKIRRTLLQGSFKLLWKHFRTVNFSNDFVHPILPFMPKITMLRNLTIDAASPRTIKTLDNFGFQAKMLKKLFRLNRLEKYCCSGDFIVNRTREFLQLTRVLTNIKSLTLFNMNVSIETLVALKGHENVLKYVPHRFRRLPHFAYFLIPNLTDAQIKQDVIRFYAKLLRDSHCRYLKQTFDRNNSENQGVLLSLASKSPKLHTLILELKLGSTNSCEVLSEVNASLKQSRSITTLIVTLEVSFDTNFKDFLKDLALHQHLRTLHLTLSKEEYTKEEIKELTKCFDHLKSLTNLTLVLSNGLWKNMDEFAIIGLYDALSKKNLTSVNLRLKCEFPSNLMAFSDKKRFFDHLCQFLPLFLSKLQNSLTGIAISLQLEYFEELQVPVEVIHGIFFALSKMKKLTKLTIKIFGVPNQSGYPSVVGVLTDLPMLNDIYIHLDFLTEVEISKLMNKFTLLKDLKRLYIGSNYLQINEKTAKLIFKFLKQKKGIIRRKFGFTCKDPKLMKLLERIR